MVEEFSLFLGLNFWDWLSFVISLIALVIAIITLYVSKRTLVSQKQTQINTTPVINRDIQRSLIEKLNLGIFDSYIRLFTIKIKLAENNYKRVPIEWVILEMKLPLDCIYVELFFDDKESFSLFDLLLARIRHFNLKIDVVNKHLKSKLSSKEKEYELLSLLFSLSLIQSSCKEIIEKVYKEKNYETILIQIKDKLTKVYESYGVSLTDSKNDYLYNEDEFLNAFTNIEHKREFRAFMNTLIESTLPELDETMINPSLCR